MSYRFRHPGTSNIPSSSTSHHLQPGNYLGVFIGAHDGGNQRTSSGDIKPHVLLHFQIVVDEDDNRTDVWRFMEVTDGPNDSLPKLIKVLSGRELPRNAFEMDLDRLAGRCCEVVMRQARTRTGNEFIFPGAFRPYPNNRPPIRAIDPETDFPQWVQERVDNSRQTRPNNDVDELFG